HRGDGPHLGPGRLFREFRLESRQGPRGGPEPVAGDDARVDGAVAAAAREFRDGSRRRAVGLRVRRRCGRHGLCGADHTVAPRAGDGMTGAVSAERTLREDQIRLGLWMFLGTVTMLFAAFTSAYIVRRSGSDWHQVALPSILWLNTAVLAASSA